MWRHIIIPGIALVLLVSSCGTERVRSKETTVRIETSETGMDKKITKKGPALHPTPTTAVGCTKQPMADDGIVRLSKIVVRPQYLDQYIRLAVEVGEISLRTEPGVLTMYAVSEKEDPCRITILETYASREAYELHVASDHFRRYKQATLHMIESLELSDQTPLNPASRIENFIQSEP